MIKVLIVDDSAVVRQVLSTELNKVDDIEVIATAVDAFSARDKVVRLKPDVVTLDLEMPRMDGLTFLRKLMKYYPIPVIIVSSLSQQGSRTAMRAMELGAVDVVSKPGAGDALSEIIETLVDKVRAAGTSRMLPVATPVPETSTAVHRNVPHHATNKVLAIGASTGGTEAIRNILLGLPADGPGTLIVQHLPAKFTAAFAERLNDQCAMEVREARDGEEVVSGLALVAPGGKHMALWKRDGRFIVEIKDGPAVFHQRPSVDVLFHSVARHAGSAAVGVLMTGMGVDGARGMVAMREAGAHTIAQDEATSVVFGMPREAIRMEGADKVLPLSQIAQQALRAIRRNQPVLQL
jgi:two-component system, chemotaxis family, protein-glutamate methylesterase/glutaminase